MRRLSFLESLTDSLADLSTVPEWNRSKLGRQIAVDLKADADFNEEGGGPSHEFLLDFRVCARFGVQFDACGLQLICESL